MSSQMYRRWPVMIYCLCLALFIVGCGGTATPTTSAPQAAAPTQAPVTKATDAPKAAAPTQAPAAKATDAPKAIAPTQAPAVKSSVQYPSSFKLGAILNLTGTAAAQGKQFRQGIEMAIEVWNKEKGGIDGVPIEGIFEDHGGNPAPAVTGARKLISVDQVPVIANVYSSPVLAVVPIADEAKVLQVSAGANSPRLAGASQFFLSNIANAAYEVEVGLNYTLKALKAQNLALVYRNDDFGNGIREALVPMWEKMGGKVVLIEGHEPDQREFATIAAKVAAARPQAVYIASSGANQGLLVKQLREGGIEVPLVSYQGLEVPELFSVAAKAAENAFWTSAAAAEDQTAFNAYAQKYKAKFGEDPTIFANNHYDLASSIFQAATDLKKAGQPWTGANIRDAMLKAGTFSGVLGPFTYRPDGTSVRALDLKTSKDGKAEVALSARKLQQDQIFDFGLK